MMNTKDGEMSDSDTYRVLIDGDWKIEDLYDFPYRYSQAYNFIFWFDSVEHSARTDGLDTRLNAYPWKGGFSYVHAYETLRKITPSLRIASMQKASPGWIDLIANLDAAFKVAKAVSFYSTAAIGAITAYKRARAYWLTLDLKAEKDRLKVAELKRKRLKANVEMLDNLAKHLGFENTSQLVRRTQDADIALGLMLAHFRRVEHLANYVKEGKAQLPLLSDKGTKG
jgi:hypothetical protein